MVAGVDEGIGQIMKVLQSQVHKPSFYPNRQKVFVAFCSGQVRGYCDWIFY